MGRVAPKIVLSSRQEDILQKQVRAHQTGQQASIRMQIILEAAKGSQNIEIAELLRVDEQRVRRWRNRWVAISKQLEEAEQQDATDGDLTARIVKGVSDEYRSGTPPKFSPEQMTQIVALACENPEDSGYPVTHWTPKELVAEAIQREIVQGISVRHLDRFLK
jgi:putative transposase